MNDLTKTEIMEKVLKLLQTDRDMNFLLSLEEKDLTTLLIALRERIEIKTSLNYDLKRNFPADLNYRRPTEYAYPVR